MTDETKQALWRSRKLRQSERFDIYLPREVALEVRRRAQIQGKRPAILAAELLAEAIRGKPWLARLDLSEPSGPAHIP